MRGCMLGLAGTVKRVQGPHGRQACSIPLCPAEAVVKTLQNLRKASVMLQHQMGGNASPGGQRMSMDSCAHEEQGWVDVGGSFVGLWCSQAACWSHRRTMA